MSEKNENLFDLSPEGINSKENKNIFESLFKDLQPSVHEMGCLKTEEDTELRTIQGQGLSAEDLPASKFHNLVRQLFFALGEARNRFLDIEEIERKIEVLENNDTENPWKLDIIAKGGFLDIEKRRLENHLWQRKYSLVEQLNRVQMFKKYHDALIKLNGGKTFTYEQFKKEQPEFYTNQIAQLAMNDYMAKNTGVSLATVNVHQLMTRPSLLDGKRKIPNLFALGLDSEKQLKYYIDLQTIVERGAVKGQYNIQPPLSAEEIAKLQEKRLLLEEKKKALMVQATEVEKLQKELESEHKETKKEE